MSSYKFSSVGSRFKKQLGDLMVALHTMEPHYIRCIKPNSFNRPMDFENMNVLHQVGGGGWVAAAQVLLVSRGGSRCRTQDGRLLGRPARWGSSQACSRCSRPPSCLRPWPPAAAVRRRAGGGAHLVRGLPHQDAVCGLH